MMAILKLGQAGQTFQIFLRFKTVFKGIHLTSSILLSTCDNLTSSGLQASSGPRVASGALISLGDLQTALRQGGTQFILFNFFESQNNLIMQPLIKLDLRNNVDIFCYMIFLFILPVSYARLFPFTVNLPSKFKNRTFFQEERKKELQKKKQTLPKHSLAYFRTILPFCQTTLLLYCQTILLLFCQRTSILQNGIIHQNINRILPKDLL